MYDYANLKAAVTCTLHAVALRCQCQPVACWWGRDRAERTERNNKVETMVEKLQLCCRSCRCRLSFSVCTLLLCIGSSCGASSKDVCTRCSRKMTPRDDKAVTMLKHVCTCTLAAVTVEETSVVETKSVLYRPDLFRFLHSVHNIKHHQTSCLL